MDDTDRQLLALLQEDATRSYAALGQMIGLSAGATHERVRKLRERGVIRRTTIDIDPPMAGRPVLAYVLVEAGRWMGDDTTGRALKEIPEIEEAHITAGAATLLLKVRTPTTAALQEVLRRIFTIEGVTGTQTTVVLESFFDRPLDPR